MKKKLTIITCDLCGHREDPTSITAANKAPMQMHELTFSATDQAGHSELFTKDICDECRKKVKAL